MATSIRKQVSFGIVVLLSFLGVGICCGIWIFYSSQKRPVIYSQYMKSNTPTQFDFLTKSFSQYTEGFNENHGEELYSPLHYSSGGDGSYSSIEDSSSKFDCIGACFCDEPGRRSTSLVEKGLFFSSFAISSYAVIKVASEYFQDECKKRFSVECTGNVEGNVDSCSRVVESEDSFVEENEVIKKTYYCTGFCLMNGNLKRHETRDAATKVGCEKMTTSGEVLVDSSFTSGVSADVARIKFQKSYLTEYCKHKSEAVVPYNYYNQGVKRLKRYRVSLCVGDSRVQKSYEGNIRCYMSKN